MNEDTKEYDALEVVCPVPDPCVEVITTAHGGGGKMQGKLIENVFKAAFGEALQTETDSAKLSLDKGLTVVKACIHEYLYRGNESDFGLESVGDVIRKIKKSGLRPGYIAAAFILEEGFSVDKLSLIAQNMQWVAEKNGVKIVTGDTKVVARGLCPGIILTLTCIGEYLEHVNTGNKSCFYGDDPDVGCGFEGDAEEYKNIFSNYFGHARPTDGPSSLFNLRLKTGQAALTTDGHVVSPLFFPGGDIGKLAICGTVNDLLVSGARPMFLLISLVIERGFSKDKLRTIIQSISAEAELNQTPIIDVRVRVVDSGVCDGVYITTTGLGDYNWGRNIADIHPRNIQGDDVIILSRDIGRHGSAVMVAREGLSMGDDLESDVASLLNQVRALMNAPAVEVRAMRDLTRGGLASALNEIASVSGFVFEIYDQDIIVSEPVSSLCEILGFDPKSVANEGAMIIVVSRVTARWAVNLLRANGSPHACIIGDVLGESGSDRVFSNVVLNLPTGVCRILDMVSGEQLPRIC